MNRLLLTLLMLPLVAFGADRDRVTRHFYGRYGVTSANSIWFASTYTSFTAATTRSRHWLTETNTSFLRLVYSPFTSAEAAFGNQFEIAASVETADGAITPVTFSGARLKLVNAATDWVYSDWTHVVVPKGTNIWIRTFCNRIASSGYSSHGETGLISSDQTYWPDMGRIRGVVGGTGEGVSWTGSTGVNPFTYDLTDSGTISASDNEGYWPVMVQAYSDIDYTKSAAIVGDSISAGSQDSAYDGFIGGFVARALHTNKIAYVNLALGGAKASQWPSTASMRTNLVNDNRVAIVELGTNDILTDGTDVDTTKARLLAAWTDLKNRGLRVFACTILPRATSTDGWMTTANQTTVTTSSFNATRIAVNDWIRTTPSPLSGYFETADAVESARDSGKWKAPDSAAETVTATGGSSSTCVKTGAGWTVNGYAGYTAYNVTQSKVAQIKSNTATTLTMDGVTSWACSNTDTVLVFLGNTVDGVHPTANGHVLASQAINTALW